MYKEKLKYDCRIYNHSHLPIKCSLVGSQKGGKWLVHYSTKVVEFNSTFPTKSVAIKVIKTHGFITKSRGEI